MHGKCSLCLEQRKLKTSHIIPKFVIAWLKNSQLGRIRSAEAPNVRIQDSLKIPLLCADCEGEFSKWETPFSQKVFLPMQKGPDPKQPVHYGPWAIKCLVSISWRVAHHFKQRSGLPHYSQDLLRQLDAATEQWRLFLRGEETSVGPYTQQLLPLGIIQDHTIPNPSPFMNRYIVGSIDLDLLRSKTQAYTFAKLGPLLLFGTIMDKRPEDWQGTAMASGNGTIQPDKFSAPADIFHYLNARATSAGQILSKISQKQKALIDKSLQRDLGRYVETDLAKAIAADIDLSGSKAFEITGDDDREVKRK